MGGTSNTTGKDVSFAVWQRSPIMVACKSGNANLVAYFIANGANPTKKSMFGHNLLSWAVYNSGRVNQAENSSATHEALVRLLLSYRRVHSPYLTANGAEYAVTELGDTVLHFAARAENSALLAFLLAFGTFDIALTNSRGNTALAECPQMAPVFAEHNRMVAEAGSYTGTVTEAVQSGNIYFVKKRLDDGADVNAANEDGVPLLSLAIHARDTHMVCYLLFRGADPLKADKVGSTPLAVACGSGNLEAVR